MLSIERELIKELDIPIFHDDQHGTAIVTSAALLNCARLTNKKLNSLTAIVSGTGAAGSSIIRMIKNLGIKTIYAYNSGGMVSNYDGQNFVVKELLDDEVLTLWDASKGNTLADGTRGRDIFIGVSVAKILTKEVVRSMNPNPWVFAMANPEPEIRPELAIEAGAYIVGTGRSDYPNQVNNLLAFPGIFKGALLANAKKITEGMKLAAAHAISSYMKDKELRPDNILPSNLDHKVVKIIAEHVKIQAIKEKITRN